jgi:hypothetical protein
MRSNFDSDQETIKTSYNGASLKCGAPLLSRGILGKGDYRGFGCFLIGAASAPLYTVFLKDY